MVLNYSLIFSINQKLPDANQKFVGIYDYDLVLIIKLSLL